jgi:two-component system heavy metal sensor histidine kinase CusS
MVMLYWGISQSLRNHSIAYMRDEIAVIASLVKTDDYSALSRKIISSDKKEYAKLYVRVLDVDNRPILETPSMGHLIPVKAFHSAVPYNSPIQQDFEKLRISGNDYILETFYLNGQQGKKSVQIALDISKLEHVLDDYALKIFATLMGGVVLAGLAGRYITSLGLRPLQAIAEKTRQITASKLGERFASEPWPLELTSLVISLDTMMDRLQESFDRMRSYAANLAHEIRTPIGILRGESEVALSRRRSCEEYEKVLESSLEEFERLTRIVESLLFLAMADSREVELKLEAVRVNEEIHNMQDYYADYAQGVAFIVMCDPGLLVWADPTLLRRALSNLIINAIKYSPEDKLLTISAERNFDKVEISVSDKGKGIEREHLDRLFDRFYRVSSGGTANVKGSGLGLSIVRSIMILHGGTVSIDSEIGVGTTVKLSFPADKPL